MIAKKLAAIAAMACLAAMIACPARADDSSRLGVDTLKGLHGVNVVVENLDDDLIKDGVSKDTIQSNVESQLKKAGITVMDDDGFKNDPAHPYLYVRVSSFKSNDGTCYAYDIDVELNQAVTLQNGTSNTLAETWETGCIGIVTTANVSHLYDHVSDEVGEFVSDFTSANPSSSSSAHNSAPAHKPAQVASR